MWNDDENDNDNDAEKLYKWWLRNPRRADTIAAILIFLVLAAMAVGIYYVCQD